MLNAQNAAPLPRRCRVAATVIAAPLFFLERLIAFSVFLHITYIPKQQLTLD
jgi:hypothetical protein